MQQQQQRHNQDIPHFVLAHIVSYLDKPNEIQVISHSARNFFRHEMNWTFETTDPICDNRARELLNIVQKRTAQTQIYLEPCNDITLKTWRDFSSVDSLKMNLRNVSAYVLRTASETSQYTRPQNQQILSAIYSLRKD